MRTESPASTEISTTASMPPQRTDPSTGAGGESVKPSARPPVIGFLGVMNYRPNVDAACWFVAQVWPRIRERYARAEFRIAGRKPVWKVRRLSGVPGVNVVGEVEDVWAEMRLWDVSVAPLRIARGLQNKVLEAMAAGKAVVLTSAAANGIQAPSGEAYVVADGSSDFAAAVLRLLDDAAFRESVGTAARRFVARHHDWKDVLNDFEFVVTGVRQRESAARELGSVEAVRTAEAVSLDKAEIGPTLPEALR